MAARHIVLSSDAANNIKRGGGSKFAFHEITSAPALASELAALPNGLVYALAVLRPYRELPIDRTELDAAWRVLAGDAPLPAFDDFSIVIGRIGESPLVTRTGRSPFRARTAIGTSTVDVRMESWLPTDTIRRSGFGHVIVDRQHVLALDRGISLVVLGSPGPPVFTAYRAGLFAPVRRLVPITSDYLFPCYR
jgi:hypothetical protein